MAAGDGSPQKRPRRGTRELPRARLGRTGLMVSAPMLGGVGLGAIYGDTSEEDAIATVRRAVERGINFIDTSPLYGESEKRLGVALRTLTAEQRRDLLICSKVGDDCPPYSDNGGHHAMSKEGVRCSVENSLRNIGVNRLDVVLLHDPTLPDVERFLGPGGGMEALVELRSQGKVGHFGIGSVDHAQILTFMQSKNADCSVLLSVNDYNLLRRYAQDGDVIGPGQERGSSLFAEAQWRDVGIINAGAYYMGLLADPLHGWELGFKKATLLAQFPKLVHLARHLQAWCEEELPAKRGIDPIPIRALALQYSLRPAAVATVPIGCRSAKEIDEVCDAALMDIPEAVWTELEARFGPEINALDCKSDHWRYNKEESDLGDK